MKALDRKIRWLSIGSSIFGGIAMFICNIFTYVKIDLAGIWKMDYSGYGAIVDIDNETAYFMLFKSMDIAALVAGGFAIAFAFISMFHFLKVLKTKFPFELLNRFARTLMCLFEIISFIGMVLYANEDGAVVTMGVANYVCLVLAVLPALVACIVRVGKEIKEAV